jgi:hypothetical protein
MAIVVDLTPEVEARLRQTALNRGQDVQVMVAELIQDELLGEDDWRLDLQESALLSQEILAKEWMTEAEDEAWQDL